MSSICPKCKFLLTCDVLYKDSIIECEDFKDNRNNQKTNADRLRIMSYEELADFLTGDFCELLRGSPLFCGGQCKEKCLEWLKKENDE